MAGSEGHVTLIQNMSSMAKMFRVRRPVLNSSLAERVAVETRPRELLMIEVYSSRVLHFKNRRPA